MDSEYQPISRVERLKAAHPWLLEAQAWKLLSIKYVLMGPELTIHNPDHLELIMVTREPCMAENRLPPKTPATPSMWKGCIRMLCSAWNTSM